MANQQRDSKALAIRSAPSIDVIAVAPRSGTPLPHLRAQRTMGAAPAAGDLAAVLGGLARLLAPFLVAELGGTSSNDGDAWIDQGASPLGRRLHCSLARRGLLPARKVGRRWLVRRAELDAFISQPHDAPARHDDDTKEQDAQELRVRALCAKNGFDVTTAAKVLMATSIRRFLALAS